MTDRWTPKVEALRRLIAPDSGATDAERDTATEKLEQILKDHHGEIEGHRRYADFEQAISSDPSSFDSAFAATFTTRDFLDLKRAGMSNGEWTAPTMEGAIQMMVADYSRRRAKMRSRPRIGANETKEWGKR